MKLRSSAICFNNNLGPFLYMRVATLSRTTLPKPWTVLALATLAFVLAGAASLDTDRSELRDLNDSRYTPVHGPPALRILSQKEQLLLKLFPRHRIQAGHAHIQSLEVQTQQISRSLVQTSASRPRQITSLPLTQTRTMIMSFNSGQLTQQILQQQTLQ